MASNSTLPLTMRAAQWRSIKGGIDKNLTLVTDAKLPKNASSLPKGQTLVKVAYASVNHLDYKIAEMPPASLIFSKPVTPGLDFSGTIVSTTLNEFQSGQKVFGRTELPIGGTLAEYVVVGSKGMAALPGSVELRDAACLGICGTTALQCMSPFVKAGGKVFINGGSGGVGVFAIQVAKALGCSHVTVTCSASNADFCRSLGADETVDYKSEDPIEVLKKKEDKFDFILDTVFNDPDLYWRSHEYLKPEGQYVCVGLPPRFQTFKALFAINMLPRWLGGGKRKFKYHSVSANRKDFGQFADWMKEGKVKVIIEEDFGLEDAGRAYARLKGGRTKGKLVVRVGGEAGGDE
ncbi:related to zinc alcohol dehydrogenase [Fusarium fujikuroi]|uniref:Enoyl reductase (ER) domain-containing protein n=1 Tax=Fusarium fujikuroi TaxID=5127 RepID=A0A2H3RX91_FUSFU|nr:zinc alcohol dehydrogenase [Fusarium fujikuroi]SCN65684.1 related to zinc alcohol dehydrogenase [Fusarium fujikuroi]SCO01886.1 related to zinc alcohol dehydrogenase [Fusarium fujikuroi]SCO06298.1 related to zinc alcohol dehydrogenase [Fusarium fujikuroi]SCO46960.1 related to zinc alcohol dehydrogenase [Fusarium fujikuroi]